MIFENLIANGEGIEKTKAEKQTKKNGGLERMKRTKSELIEALNEALKTIRQLEAKVKSAQAQKQEKVEVKIYKVWTATTKNGKNQTGDVHILNEKQATNQWNNYLKSFDNKNKPAGTIKQLINNKVEILQAKQWNMTTKKPKTGEIK